MAVRRGKDFRVLYDQDDLGQTLAIQRTYFELTNPTIVTPITPSFLVRVALAEALIENLNLDGLPIPIGRIGNLRRANACIPNSANQSGESNFQCVLPWHPLTAGLKFHLNEIKAWPNVAAITYYGETNRRRANDPQRTDDPQLLPTPDDLPTLPPSEPPPLPPGAPDPPALPPGDP